MRICPACDTHLINPDDAVLTTLRPSEDYKTSVLSGLSPAVIMECASRGMAFFQYQITQELVYQEHMTRALTERYTQLNTQLDNIRNEANTEINDLKNQLVASQHDRKGLAERNAELVHAYKEKVSAQQQLRQQYQELKNRVNAVAVEDAANHTVENVVQGLAHGNRADNGRGVQRPNAVHARGQPSPTMFTHGRQGSGHSGGQSAYQYNDQENMLGETPHHREQFRGPSFDNRQPIGSQASIARPTPTRQPLGAMDPNAGYANNNGYGLHAGMSAGMKVGRQAGSVANRATPAPSRGLGNSILGMR
ncbi:hypothetical protein MBLNU457_5034t1 [Dothideomycetes sp. NU457]